MTHVRRKSASERSWNCSHRMRLIYAELGRTSEAFLTLMWRTGTTLSTEEEAGVCVAWLCRCRILALKGGIFDILCGRQFKTLCSTHRSALVKCRKFQPIGAATGWRTRPYGRFFFRASYRASYSLTRNAARGCALSFAVNRKGQTKLKGA